MSSPKKRGEGTSCHHCKKRIRPNEMLKCTRGEIVPTNSRKRKRPCVKKYCLHCIKTFYSNQYLDDNSSGSFICPACRDECRCAACRRRVMKARLKNDGSALENEADGQANSILESQTPDATNIEEGQVNGLLEILDSRPDVQDIIRRGMAMDFADDNAKILYVGHLIDQALTRPDVLALYYASSHGRANNCRIKTEGKGTSNNNNNNSNDNNDNTTDLPPETPMDNDIDSPPVISTGSNSPTNHHRNSKRKKRNHSTSNGYSNGRRHKHKKNKYYGENLPPITTVKQEPTIIRNGGGGGGNNIQSQQQQQQHNNNGHNNNNNNNGHNNGNNKNGHNMMIPNGISAPQPATISLSGGNPMSFMNSVTFPPPIGNTSNMGNISQPHLSGVNGINNTTNLPPIHLPFHSNKIPQIPLNNIQQIMNVNNSNNSNGDTSMNDTDDSNNSNVPPPPSLHSDHQTNNNANHDNYNNNNNQQPSNGNNNTNNNHNGNIFPMNVTPSVMMGGPPLASM